MSTYTEDGDYWHDRWEEAQEQITALKAQRDQLQKAYDAYSTRLGAVLAERDRYRAERDEARREVRYLGEGWRQTEDRYRAALEKIADGAWTSEALTVSGFARHALREALA